MDLPPDLEFLRPHLHSDNAALRRHVALRLAMARGGPAPGVPPRAARPTIPLPAGGVVVRGVADAANGYGLLGLRLAEGLAAQGVPVAFHAVVGGEGVESYGGAALYPMRTHDTPPGAVVLTAITPDQPVRDGERTVFFTMWETTRLRASQVANLNRALAVVVPCRWCAENFRASGVEVPIRVVPLGWASADGYGRSSGEREDAPGLFRVGMAARVGHGQDATGGGGRKGIREGMVAFLDAFPDDPDARLEVKAHVEDRMLLEGLPTDPRVRLIIDDWPSAALAGWYRTLDLLLVPSKGEGWGLHTIQAMACGTPAAAAPWSGTSEFLDDRTGYALGYDVEEVPETSFYKGLGEWAVPRHDAMVATLRAARNDPEARHAKGAAAAAAALSYPWDRTARETLAVLGGFDLARGTIPDEDDRGEDFLGAFIPAHRLPRLDRAVASVRGFVDRLLVGVDLAAPREVEEWLDARGIAHFRVDVNWDHAGSTNAGAARLGTRWVLKFDSDEEIDPEAAARLRATCRRAEARGADGVWLRRRHWHDLGRTRPALEGALWPDPQLRLFRAHVRFRGRVHPRDTNADVAICDDSIVIEHLNFAMRSREDWAHTNAHYARLAEMDEADTARERVGRERRARPAATSAVPSVREVHRKLARMRSCPHWSHPPGMG